MAAVGESCAEVVEVVDESGAEIAMFITVTDWVAMSVVV